MKRKQKSWRKSWKKSVQVHGGKEAKTVVVWLWRKKKKKKKGKKKKEREKHNHRWLGCFVNEPRVGKRRDARLRNACVRSWIRTCVHACLSVWWCPVHPRIAYRPTRSFSYAATGRQPRQTCHSIEFSNRRTTPVTISYSNEYSGSISSSVWRCKRFKSLTRGSPTLWKFELLQHVEWGEWLKLIETQFEGTLHFKIVQY